jgi:hypothetical protein
MKHATPAALDRLEPLLVKLRAHALLKEKSRGAFYLRGKAFVRFHEHGEELFADIRLDPNADFDRLPATSASDRAALLKKIEKALSSPRSRS